METSKLNQILERHKLWVETKGKQGVCADLSYENLRGAYLRGATLWGAYLKGANFSDANLRGANLGGANLTRADLGGADLTGANLTGAYLWGADLSDAVGLPNVSWIIPGCLVRLNQIEYDGFYLEKGGEWENFVQDSLGFFIQNNPEEGTFDMLVRDRIIRDIPHWVKYSGLKQVAADSKDKTND